MHITELWPGIHNCQQEFLWITDFFRHQSERVSSTSVYYGARNQSRTEKQQPDLKTFSAVISLLFWFLVFSCWVWLSCSCASLVTADGPATRSLATDTKGTCKTAVCESHAASCQKPPEQQWLTVPVHQHICFQPTWPQGLLKDGMKIDRDASVRTGNQAIVFSFSH